MNRDSNAYTFLFAAAMVMVVASSLAFTATSLKSRQADNIRKEKMQNILATIGIETDREKPSFCTRTTSRRNWHSQPLGVWMKKPTPLPLS